MQWGKGKACVLVVKFVIFRGVTGGGVGDPSMAEKKETSATRGGGHTRGDPKKKGNLADRGKRGGKQAR